MTYKVGTGKVEFQQVLSQENAVTRNVFHQIIQTLPEAQRAQDYARPRRNQIDLEESPLAKGVEASAGGEKPEVMHESLEECSKGHGHHRLQQGVSFKSRK